MVISGYPQCIRVNEPSHEWDSENRRAAECWSLPVSDAKVVISDVIGLCKKLGSVEAAVLMAVFIDDCISFMAECPDMKGYELKYRYSQFDFLFLDNYSEIKNILRRLEVAGLIYLIKDAYDIFIYEEPDVFTVSLNFVEINRWLGINAQQLI